MAKKIPQINASSMADISFLLLIFFLVTTSMDVNQGLARRLPEPIPPDQKIEDTDINKRNLMVVKINSMNQIMVQGEVLTGDEKSNLKELRKRVKEFIKNENDDPSLPKLVDYNDPEHPLPDPFHDVKYTKDHVISVQNDVDTKYQAYLNVQNELVAAYNELRDECAHTYFNKGYNELNEDMQKCIQKIYPQKISEAEPKNYGGK